ncbi:MAG TPA: UDP-N-acetylmuramoyl-tripeptide--D-alanyl-D-alanine ligase [Clostridiales bacterium]|nr:UDP-N-acetylmuramoyl-tripeptide--D-alanyl-D-alanine ligase [Clostridiales bacterium]
MRSIAFHLEGTLLGEDCVVDTVGIDSRTLPRGGLFVALIGERNDGHDFIPSLVGRAEAVICQRKVDADIPQIVVLDTVEALGKLAKFSVDARSTPLIKIAITGSVGKTTTKELCGHVLNAALPTHRTQGNKNNHLGLPLTMLSLHPDDTAMICEMGMNAKGEISYLSSLLRPQYAIVTNIGTAHIGRLGSREEIRTAKLELCENMDRNGVLIVDGNEPLLRDKEAFSLYGGRRVIFVGKGANCDVRQTALAMHGDECSFRIASMFGEERDFSLPITGAHNAANALYAYTLAKLLNLSDEDIQSGFTAYQPIGMRQHIYEKNGIKYIADCYNAGPESMIASLRVLCENPAPAGGRKVAVLGDMLELGSFSEAAHRRVGATFATLGGDVLYTLGENARFIAASAQENGAKEVYSFSNSGTLVEALKYTLRQKDTVLFKASNGMHLDKVIEALHVNGE